MSQEEYQPLMAHDEFNTKTHHPKITKHKTQKVPQASNPSHAMPKGNHKRPTKKRLFAQRPNHVKQDTR